MESVKKNYIYQVIYQVLISIIPFITSPYLSRVIGANGIGIYSYTYSIVTYFKIFASLGIGTYGNRVIAKARDDKKKLSQVFLSLFRLHAILTLIVMITYVIYLGYFVVSNRMLAVIEVIYLIGEFFDINWFFFGLEKFKLTVTRNIIVKITTVLLIFIFVNREDDLWKYTLILALGTAISTACVWIFLPRYIVFCRVTFREVFLHIKPMIILFFSVVAISIFSYMDKIMIGSLSSMTELGYYENAWKIIEFPVGFITALGTVMTPKISNLVSKKTKPEIEGYIYKSMRFSLIMAIAIAFGIAGIAKDFSIWFWGEDFAKSGILIVVMATTIVLMSWNAVIRTQYLLPMEKDKIYLLAVVIGAGVNFIANYLLIKRYGSVGAAVGTVLARIAVCLVQSIYVRHNLQIGKYLVESIPYLIWGCIMFGAINRISKFTGATAVGVCLEVLVGIMIYGFLSLSYAIVFSDKFVINQCKNLIEIIKKVK